MFQFMVLYRGYYYKYHCLYIFTIHFLFSFTQFYSLLFVLSINCYYSSSVCLSIVAISAFVVVYSYCWCLCACLRSELVSLSPCFVVAIGAFVLVWAWCQCLYLVPSYSWCRVAIVWRLSLVYLPIYSCC